MATTINAVTSAGGGLAVTGDSSGVLGFQSAGTTYMTMDTSGNLGVGTSSPAYPLDVSGIGRFGGATPTIYVQPATATNNALYQIGRAHV